MDNLDDIYKEFKRLDLAATALQKVKPGSDNASLVLSVTIVGDAGGTLRENIHLKSTDMKRDVTNVLLDLVIKEREALRLALYNEFASKEQKGKK